MARIELTMKQDSPEHQARYGLCFGADRLFIDDRSSSVELTASRSDVVPDEISALLGNPFSLAETIRRSKVMTPISADSISGPRIGRHALVMLLRHDAVRDLVFGSNGSECSLQFQLAAGFASVCPEAPLDWIGLDFSEKSLDLSWFDPEGRLVMASHKWPKHAAVIDEIVLDPLAAVLRAGQGTLDHPAATGARALLLALTRRLDGEQ